MAEYIEREAAIKSFCNGCIDEKDCHASPRKYVCAEVETIKAIPAADVRPVVRGKWRERRFSEDVYGAECSICHTTWDAPTNFCPNCGADMREKT